MGGGQGDPWGRGGSERGLACLGAVTSPHSRVSWSESSLGFYNLTNVQQMPGEVSQGMHSQQTLYMLV